jgi:hypothetical protein
LVSALLAQASQVASTALKNAFEAQAAAATARESAAQTAAYADHTLQNHEALGMLFD